MWGGDFDQSSDWMDEEGKEILAVDRGEEAEDNILSVKGHKGSYSESRVE